MVSEYTTATCFCDACSISTPSCITCVSKPHLNHDHMPSKSDHCRQSSGVSTFSSKRGRTCQAQHVLCGVPALTLQFLVPRKGRIIRGDFLLIRKRRKRIKLHNQHRVIGFWEGATESDESSWLQERRRMEQRSLSNFLFSVPCRYQSPVCTM